MKSITISRDLTSGQPFKVHSPIKPLCVPMKAADGFSEEISGRFDNRVYSLWERLGLIFLEEKNTRPQISESRIVVNNFTQQVIFRLFSQRNIYRLINFDQPGFVLIDKAYSKARRAKHAVKRRIAEALEKRIARKTVYARELENAMRLLSGEYTNESGLVSEVTDEALNRVLLSVIRKAKRERTINERSISALVNLNSAFKKRESRKETVRELNSLLETVSRTDTERINSATKKILSRIEEHIGGETAAQTQSEKRDMSVKRVMMKAADRAAELALSGKPPLSAERIAELFSLDFPIRFPRAGYAENNHVVGKTAVENRAAVGAASAVNGYDAASSADLDIISKSNSSEKKELAAGDPREAARGTVLSNGNELILEAAVFFLEKAEEQLLPQGTQSSNSAAKSLLREKELVRLINEVAKQYHSELSELFRLSGISGDPIQRVSREAIGAIKYISRTDIRENRGVESASASDLESRKPEHVTENLGGRSMTASLLSRVSGYIADKLSYEGGSGVSLLSALNGSDSYKEYRFLARAEKYIPKALSARPLSQSNYIISRGAGVYTARYVDTFFGNSDRGEGNTAIVNNIGGEIRNVMRQGGAVSSVNNSYSNNTEISYNEGSRNESNTTIVNNIGGKIRNVMRQGGAVSSVNNSYSDNTEISYNEGSRNESNTTIVNNIGGEIRNVTRQGGTVSSVNNGYIFNESIVYSENNAYADLSKTSTQPTGLPTREITRERDGEVRAGAVGSARPFRKGERPWRFGNRNGSVEAGGLANVSERGTTLGAVLPERYGVGISYIDSRYVLGSAETENAENASAAEYPVYPKHSEQADRSVNVDISYRDGDEIFRTSKALQKDRAASFGRISSYRDRLDNKTIEALDKIISQARQAERSAVSTGGIERAANTAKGSAEISSFGSTLSYVTDNAANGVRRYIAQSDVRSEHTEIVSEREAAIYGSLITESTIPKIMGDAEIRILFRSLKNAAKLKSGIYPAKSEGQHLTRVISALEKQTEAEKDKTFSVKSGFSFRTIEDGEEMVMLVPPTQIDRGMAESGYVRSLPPIDHRQREEQPATYSVPSKPKVINNMQSSVQTVKGAVSGGFENMTREEINKLADMVYEQLRTRIMRERRRVGM